MDQDCDGDWDEAIERDCYTGDPVGIDVGLCVQGIEECRAERGSGVEAWGICAGETTPRDDDCNGLDDDCDAAIDENIEPQACYSGRRNTEGRGICRGGLSRCEGAAGFSDTCEGEILPERERCNAINDDCDGATDEDFDVGDDCTRGQGECQRAGVRICNAAQDGTRCNAVAGNPNAEACNTRDDDCDGDTDEGVLNACDACGAVPEDVCNGLDDDCDGQTDEDVLNACGECGDVPAETCNGLDDDCDGQTDEGLLNACGECGDVPAETCNGEDDDCDGDTDEGLEINACGDCTALPEEICNGDDDDCDGDADEGLQLNACGACGEAPVEVCDGGNVDEDCDDQIDEGFDLETDNDNCGSCGVRCDSDRVDHCEAGQCVCGDRGEPCPDDRRCGNGSCRRR
ncbi:MAG: Notch-like protein [Bradymonadia bacterium]